MINSMSDLVARIERLEYVLGILISKIPGGLSAKDARNLINMLPSWKGVMGKDV